MNSNYRVAVAADVTVGARVFAYYVSPDPTVDSLGVVGDVDSDGWARVDLDNGRCTFANAERLAVTI